MNKIQIFKNRLEEYVSIIPLIKYNSFKTPLDNDYVLKLQNGLTKNQNISDIEFHINALEQATNRSLLSICGFGVFNFLPVSIKSLVEINQKAYVVNASTNGFFNVKPLDSKLTLENSDESISNGLIEIFFKNAYETNIKTKKQSFIFNFYYNFSKKPKKYNIINTYISEDTVNAVMSYRAKFINIKKSIKMLIEDCKVTLTHIFDRLQGDAFQFSVNFGDNQKLLSKQQKNDYYVINYTNFSIITRGNIIATDNEIKFVFSEINNFRNIVRELVEVEIFFNLTESNNFKTNIENEIDLKAKPLVKIIGVSSKEDIPLYISSNENIVLKDIIFPSDEIGLVLKIKNTSEQEVITEIKYLNLNPKYILKNDLTKDGRCFGGVRLLGSEEKLILMS